MTKRVTGFIGLAALAALAATAHAGEGTSTSTRVYENRLKPIADPQSRPILADYPQFVEPVREVARFEAPILVDDPGADLEVRAWRFSYNARGIIEVPNRLRADRTAVIVVHPWGIDDGQGWRTPEPAGVAFQCTPAKNRIVFDHAATVIDPFLKAMRGKVAMVAYSLPGREDPIRKKLYRSFRGQPGEQDRDAGPARARGEAGVVPLSGTGPANHDHGLGRDADGRLLPPVPRPRRRPCLRRTGFLGPADPRDEIDRGRPARRRDLRRRGLCVLRDFLKKNGVRHVLLAGYNTDMCVCSTTAGYKNLSQDFDVFLVGDATIATFPAHPTPRFATTSAVCFAALNLFITQVSWVRPVAVVGVQGR